MKRVGLAIVLASATLLACTFTRSLDYLQQPETDAGDGTSSSTSSSGTTTSSSSGAPVDGGVAGTPVVQGQLNPAHLAQDKDNLYWTNDNNQVMRVAKAGGDAKELTKLVVSGVAAIDALTVDPATGNVFILVGGGVKTVPHDGGPATDFITSTTIVSIAADETFLFTISVNDDTAAPTLTRYPKAAGNQPTVIGPPATPPYSDPGALVLFEDSVYWTLNDDQAVQVLHQLPKTAAPGTVPIVWKSTGKNKDKEVAGVYALYDYELAVDKDAIYWIDDYDTVPYRLSRSTPVADGTTLLNASVAAKAIALDDAFVYVVTTDKIVKLKKSDLNSRDSYSVAATTSEIITDANAIYYVFAGDDVKATGGINRIPKP
jgi:hypothetical protein